MAACSFGGSSRHVQHCRSKRFGNFNAKNKMKEIYFFLCPGSLKIPVPFRLLEALSLCAQEQVADGASPVNRLPLAK